MEFHNLVHYLHEVAVYSRLVGFCSMYTMVVHGYNYTPFSDEALQASQ